MSTLSVNMASSISTRTNSIISAAKTTPHTLHHKDLLRMKQPFRHDETFAPKARYAERLRNEAGTQDYFRELLYRESPSLRLTQPSTEDEWDAFIVVANKTATTFDWTQTGLGLHNTTTSLAKPMERFVMDSPTPWLDRFVLGDKEDSEIESNMTISLGRMRQTRADVAAPQGLSRVRKSYRLRTTVHLKRRSRDSDSPNGQ